jgi:hypothetical protein
MNANAVYPLSKIRTGGIHELPHLRLLGVSEASTQERTSRTPALVSRWIEWLVERGSPPPRGSLAATQARGEASGRIRKASSSFN